MRFQALVESMVKKEGVSVSFNLRDDVPPFTAYGTISLPASWAKLEIKREYEDEIYTILFNELQHINNDPSNSLERMDIEAYVEGSERLARIPKDFICDACDVLRDCRDDQRGFSEYGGAPRVYSRFFRNIVDEIRKDTPVDELTTAQKARRVLDLAAINYKKRTTPEFAGLDTDELFKESGALADIACSEEIVRELENYSRLTEREIGSVLGNGSNPLGEVGSRVAEEILRKLKELEPEPPTPPSPNNDESDDDPQGGEGEENDEQDSTGNGSEGDGEGDSGGGEGGEGDEDEDGGEGEDDEDDDNEQDEDEDNEDDSQEDEDDDEEQDGNEDEGEDGGDGEGESEDEDGPEGDESGDSGDGDGDKGDGEGEGPGGDGSADSDPCSGDSGDGNGDGLEGDGGEPDGGDPDGGEGGEGGDEGGVEDSEFADISDYGDGVGNGHGLGLGRLQDIMADASEPIDVEPLADTLRRMFDIDRVPEERVELNTRNLWALNADPEFLFEGEREIKTQQDWTIALVVDCSGSMEGHDGVTYDEKKNRITKIDMARDVALQMQRGLKMVNEHSGSEHKLIVTRYHGEYFFKDKGMLHTILDATTPFNEDGSPNLDITYVVPSGFSMEEINDRIRDNIAKPVDLDSEAWVCGLNPSGGTFPASGIESLKLALDESPVDDRRLLVILLTDGALDANDIMFMEMSRQDLPEDHVFVLIELGTGKPQWGDYFAPTAGDLPEAVESAFAQAILES